MLCCVIGLLVLLNAQSGRTSSKVEETEEVDESSVEFVRDENIEKGYNFDIIYNYTVKGKAMSREVTDVLLQVDRTYYLPYEPFEKFDIPIGYAAHSPPMKVTAVALEVLKDHLKEGNRVLDIGTGTGYTATCLALMVGKTGKVVSMEHVRELVVTARKNINNDRPMLLQSKRLILVEGDGRVGMPSMGPYDAIHLGAMVDMVPVTLLQQLKNGGRMVMPKKEFKEKMLIDVIVAVDRLINGTVVEKEVERFDPDIIVDYLTSNETQLKFK